MKLEKWDNDRLALAKTRGSRQDAAVDLSPCAFYE